MSWVCTWRQGESGASTAASSGSLARPVLDRQVHREDPEAVADQPLAELHALADAPEAERRRRADAAHDGEGGSAGVHDLERVVHEAAEVVVDQGVHAHLRRAPAQARAHPGDHARSARGCSAPCRRARARARASRRWISPSPVTNSISSALSAWVPSRKEATPRPATEVVPETVTSRLLVSTGGMRPRCVASTTRSRQTTPHSTVGPALLLVDLEDPGHRRGVEQQRRGSVDWPLWVCPWLRGATGMPRSLQKRIACASSWAFAAARHGGRHAVLPAAEIGLERLAVAQGRS